MPATSAKSRFGPFELDPRSGELRKNGVRIKLQGQPIHVLDLLLEKPGELVTREEIRQRLWSSDTFVDFDHNLNTAVKKLRQALGDEAEMPRYIETVPKYGYRFIGEISSNGAPNSVATSASDVAPDAAGSAAKRDSTLISSSWWSQYRLASLLILAVILVALLALIAALRYPYRKTTVARPLVRSQLSLNIFTGPTRALQMALSPDGRYVAYVDGSRKRMLRLWDLQKGSEEQLAGTEFSIFPFWSPDSRSIAFFSGHKVEKITLDTRIVTVLCPQEEIGPSTWGSSGTILMGTSTGLQAVSSDGGPIRNVFPRSDEMVDTRPTFLPDGKHFLFVRQPANTFLVRGWSGTVYLGALDGSAPRSLGVRVTGVATFSSGYLLYPTERGLFAQPFDPTTARLSGQPTLLVEAGDAEVVYTTSDNDVLLTRFLIRNTELTLYSRDGKAEPNPIAEGLFDEARFSPDGVHLAYNQVRGDNQDIWIYDVQRRVNLRLTPGDATYANPVWSPDGKRLAHSYWRPPMRGLAIRNVDGSGSPDIVFETRSDNPMHHWVRSWSPIDNCLFVTVTALYRVRQIDVLCLDGDRKLHPLPNPKETSRYAQQISPDGKWLAYASTETGNPEVFIQPYPGTGESVRVSVDGGSFPDWRQDGRELYFLDSNGNICAAAITYSGNTLKAGKPTQLFRPHGSLWEGIPFDASPDGKHFVVISSPIDLTRPADVITNWDAILPH